jgi:hypothetical protein
MHRIDDPSAVASLPTPRQPGTPGFFTQGSPTTGQEATIVTDDWANATQEELCYVIEQSGITLSKTDRTQLFQALARLFRRRLTAALTVYISPTGDDSNGDGLTIATAFATINRAYTYIRDHIDLNGQQAMIQMEDGTYSSAYLSFPCVGPAVILQGNLADPTKVIVNGVSVPAIAAAQGAVIVCNSFTVEATGPAGDYGAVGAGLLAGANGQIIFRNMNFGACSQAHIAAYSGGVVSCGQTGVLYTISGGGQEHVLMDGGVVSIADANVTLSGTPNFANGYVYATNGGSWMDGWRCTFTGTATGPRYSIHNNAAVHTIGGGPNYFPGNAAGIIDTGGIYD